MGLDKDGVKYKINGKNIDIITDKGTIRLTNFATTDVTGEKGSVDLLFKDDEFDIDGNLVTPAVKVDLRDDLYLPKITPSKNHTGNWHSEKIDASGTPPKTDKNGNLLSTGVTINAGGGDDIITGSDYNDTINGGDGSDTIEGGLGNDKLTGGKDADKFIFSQGDGADIITDATSEDSIVLTDVSSDKLYFLKNGNNLQIRYNIDNNNDSITINNYFKSKTKIDRIYTSDNPTEAKSINLLLPEEYPITGTGKINGTKGNDTIYGSTGKDTISAGNGNDVIYSSKKWHIFYFFK